MKSAIAFCVLALAALALARPEEQKYTDRYDHINIEEVLANQALFNQHFACLMDQGKCPPDGKELKSHIGDALATGCSKCTDKQKEGARIVFKHLINKLPEKWEQLCNKYDPDRKYVTEYEKELKEIKEA